MQRLSLILDCSQNVWRLRLGDPSIGGLGLTALYILASLLFLRAVFASGPWAPRERLLWIVATLVLLFMTFNKQLDLQQVLGRTIGCVARTEGWAVDRTVTQRALGAAILGLGALGTVAFLWTCRRALAANIPLVIGMGLLILFVALQVARFEQMTGGLGQVIVAFKLHRLLELSALLVLIWVAIRYRPRAA